MSGEIARINQPAEGNVSLSLEFWGTTLQCETTNRTISKVFPKFIITSGYSFWTEWDSPDLFYYSDLKTQSDPQFLSANTTITHRFAPVKNITEFQYYPCLYSINGGLDEKPLEEFGTLPKTGIHVLLPIAETICRPKISRYSATIRYSAGNQNIPYHIDTKRQTPTYVQDFLNFDGSFEQWVQFSDAMTVYDQFALNLERSVGYYGGLDFWKTLPSKGVKSYPGKNGTTVDTCMVHADKTRYPMDPNQFEIWPLSVFEHRLGSRFPSENVFFDADMANELLVNSTISMLSLNTRFKVVNGTTSLTVNMHRFRNKLAFFLPYGLLLGLTIPMIALELSAFYVRNQGVSATGGSFLQLLMTTTGRTELETLIVKGSGTMGGYENVSKELKETEIRFGRLIEQDEKDAAGNSLVVGRSSARNGYATDTTRHSSDTQNNQEQAATGVEVSEGSKTTSRRDGFGMVHEVKPFRKRELD